MSAETVALLPCPWCSGTDVRIFIGDGIQYAQCMDCTSCGPDHKDGRHWNTAPRIGPYSPEVSQLLRFYSVDTLLDLIAMQARHVERLQARLPPLRDERPGYTPREG